MDLHRVWALKVEGFCLFYCTVEFFWLNSIWFSDLGKTLLLVSEQSDNMSLPFLVSFLIYVHHDVLLKWQQKSSNKLLNCFKLHF